MYTVAPDNRFVTCSVYYYYYSDYNNVIVRSLHTPYSIVCIGHVWDHLTVVKTSCN